MKTVLIVDYDGCGEIWSKYCKQALQRDMFPPDDGDDEDVFYQYFHAVKQTFTEKLCDLVAGSDTELYVGSIRQSIAIDKYNANFFQNGRCFECYESVAKERGWTFNRFLLADVVDGEGREREQPFVSGSAMQDEGLHSLPDLNKENLLKMQLKKIQAENPDEPVKVYYIDDDCMGTIFPALYKVLQDSQIPQNLTIDFIKFDFCSLIDRCLTLGFDIESAKKYVRSSLQSVRCFSPVDEQKQLIRPLIDAIWRANAAIDNRSHSFWKTGFQPCKNTQRAQLKILSLVSRLDTYLFKDLIDLPGLQADIDELAALPENIKVRVETCLELLGEVRDKIEKIEEKREGAITQLEEDTGGLVYSFA